MSNIVYEDILSTEEFNDIKMNFLNQNGGHDEEFLKEIMQDGGSIINELKTLESDNDEKELEELKKLIENKSNQSGGNIIYESILSSEQENEIMNELNNKEIFNQNGGTTYNFNNKLEPIIGLDTEQEIFKFMNEKH